MGDKNLKEFITKGFILNDDMLKNGKAEEINSNDQLWKG